VPALFELDGDDVVATLLTQGAWDPDAQYGGGPCALLTWAVEQVPTLVPMRIARLTFDLHRPVPLGRLRVATEVVREGKRLQVVVARIVRDDVEVARCTALRLRLGAGPAEGSDPGLPPVAPPSPPDECSPVHFRATGLSAFLAALEVRAPGESISPAWFRVVLPVVEGHDLSPELRVATVADFAANSANYLDQTRWSCINPDLTILFARAPRGEWTGITSRSWYDPDGTGHARADLFDLDGFVGTVTSTSLVDEVPAPFTF
jgi:hypothetical protein